MTAIGSANTGGLDPTLYQVKESAETMIFTGIFGPMGPLVNQVQNALVNTVLPQMKDGPEKQIVGFLLDPIGSLLTMLMPPKNAAAAEAGYAHGACGVGEGAPAGSTGATAGTSASAATAASTAEIDALKGQVKETRDELEALKTLEGCFSDAEMAGGLFHVDDGILTRNDLEAIVDGPYDGALKQAAHYFLDNHDKLKLLDVAGGIGKGDGGISLYDVQSRKAVVAEKLADLTTQLDQALESQLAPPPPPRSQPPPAPPRAQPPPPPVKHSPPPPPSVKHSPPPPPTGSTPDPSRTSAADDSKKSGGTTSASDTQKTDDSKKTGDTSSTDGTKKTSSSSGGTVKEFYPELGKAIDKTYDDIDKLEAELSKEVSDGGSESKIRDLQRKIQTLTTRAQMLDGLYSQLMQMMQNSSKLQNEIAMNAIRHIG